MRESIPYDFGTDQRHGIFRTIPVRYRYDDTQDRVVEVTGVTVTSPTGAPTDVDLSEDGGMLTIRIGDPDTTVTRPADYVLDYDVRGAMNQFSDHDEVFWNAIGTEWAVPIQAVDGRPCTRRRARPSACYAGPDGSALPCTAARAGGRRRLQQDTLAPYEGLTVSSRCPRGRWTSRRRSWPSSSAWSGRSPRPR